MKQFNKRLKGTPVDASNYNLEGNEETLDYPDLEINRMTLSDERILKEISVVVEHGQFVNGPEIELLEQEVELFSHTKYAVACASGTVALQMALMAITHVKLIPNVLTTPFTFVATVEAILLSGGLPCFCDIDEKTFNIDSEKYEHKDSIDVVMPVDCFGTPNTYAYIKLQFPHAVIIGDNAQGFGTIGHFSGIPDMYCTSFHPSKPLSCWGDGGMVCTNSKEYYDKLISIRNHGKGIDKYHAERIGMNGRMDTIQAAVLREKVKDYPHEIFRRVTLARKYQDLLGDCARLQKHNKLYSQFCILHENRDEIKRRLKDEGWDCQIYYPVPIHLQDAYKFLGYKEGDFPVAERVCREILALPMKGVTEADVIKICNIVKESV